MTKEMRKNMIKGRKNNKRNKTTSCRFFGNKNNKAAKQENVTNNASNGETEKFIEI